MEYVIGHIEDDEYEILQKGIQTAKEAVIDIVKNGIDHAMNAYNGAAAKEG